MCLHMKYKNVKYTNGLIFLVSIQRLSEKCVIVYPQKNFFEFFIRFQKYFLKILSEDLRDHLKKFS